MTYGLHRRASVASASALVQRSKSNNKAPKMYGTAGLIRKRAFCRNTGPTTGFANLTQSPTISVLLNNWTWMFPRFLNRPPDLTRRAALHWLLLLALLAQSLAPITMAAMVSVQMDVGIAESAPAADAATSESGIWTVSCAGKPMWLPFPAQEHTDSSPTARQEHVHRNCLFCNNATSENAIPTTAFASQWQATDTVRVRAVSTATFRSLVRQQYRPRAPPKFLHG
jgi:hypothetical protein